MLPDHPLLRPKLLHSVRSGTTFGIESLVLRFGDYTPSNIVYSDRVIPPPAEPPLLRDDSIITTIHEGIHRRQLHGTTLGAFISWLKHAREIDVFEKLHALPADRRAALLRARRDGTRLLSLDQQGQPDPPIVLADPLDPVELMRCAFMDNFLLLQLFTDPAPIVRPHAAFNQIFESTIADAATAMVRYHPAWQRFPYDAIQTAYRMSDDVARLYVRGESGDPVELRTSDVMEAGAVANELLLSALTTEKRYHSPDSATWSVWTTERNPDAERFRNNAGWYKYSGHGRALLEFFARTRFDSEFISPWVTVAVVADFALNPPLPPIVGPPSRPLSWGEIYPPIRFVLASRAARQLGPLPEKPSAAEIVQYQHKLAAVTGLAPIPQLHPLDRSPAIVDFASLKSRQLENTLIGEGYSYYHFILWCQVQTWRTRHTEPRLLPLPGTLVPELMGSDLSSVNRLLSDLALAPVIQTDPHGDLQHSAGSSPKLGSWLATSVLVWGSTQDLMMGEGTPDSMGMPPALMESEDVQDIMSTTLRHVCGEDPYG